MNLIEAAEFHRRTLERLGRSPETLRLYRTYQDVYLAFLLEHGVEPVLEALNPHLVRDCQGTVRTRSHGRRGGLVSEKQLVVTLKTWSRFLCDQDVFDFDPLTKLRVPRVPKIKRKPFSDDEARRLLAAATAGANPIRDRALLLVLLDTGCRVGELCAAQVEDLDAQAGTITFCRTKNGHPRKVGFRVPGWRDGGPCLVAVRAWLKVREARLDVGNVFTTRERYALSTRRIRELFTEWGRLARVPGAMPHTNASEFLAERPGAEIQLRSRLGQVSHAVLEDYVSISDTTAAEAAGAASLSSKWRLSGRTARQSAPRQSASPESDPLEGMLARVRQNPLLQQLLVGLLGDVAGGVS